MRHPIAIAALLAAVASNAAVATDAAAQSRYGPRPGGADTRSGVSVKGPGPSTLSWPGKSNHDPAPLQDPIAQRPEPLAPWAQRLAANTPAPQPQRPQAAAPAPLQAPVRAAPIQAAPVAAPAVQSRAALPTSLYDAPAPVRAPAPQPAPRQTPQAAANQPFAAQLAAPRAAAPQPAAPRAAPSVQAQAAPPQTALLGGPPAAAAPNSPNGPRFYSVYREYGYSPDQIPVAPVPANGARGGSVVELRDVPQTPSLAAPDDTQYVPPRTNQSSSR